LEIFPNSQRDSGWEYLGQRNEDEAEDEEDRKERKDEEEKEQDYMLPLQG